MSLCYPSSIIPELKEEDFILETKISNESIKNNYRKAATKSKGKYSYDGNSSYRRK